MKFPEQYRLKNTPHPNYRTKAGDPFGLFIIPGTGRLRALQVLASDGRGETPGDPSDVGWEHVSVSVVGSDKCPSWDEMCQVKDLFWDDTECCVQFHPAKSDYVNLHPGVLHLWRKIDGQFPMPPKGCV